MQQDNAQTLELREYLSLLWRWAWLIALAALVAAGAAYWVSERTVPVYEASSTLLINEGQKAGGPDYNSILLSERLAKSYAQLLQGRPVVQGAAAQLGLPQQGPDFDKLVAGVTVEPVRDTQLIRLKVRHTDPKTAAALANGVPLAFVTQNQAQQAKQQAASKESLLREMQSLEASIASTQAALDSQHASLTPDGAEIARLETQLSQYRSTYSGLLQSYEEVRLAETQGSSSLVVAEPADVPKEPVLPRTGMNTLLAGLTGAMLAAGVALLVEYLDDTVKGPEDLESAAHLPMLAGIGRIPARLTKAPVSLAAAQPGEAVAEAYGMLSTTLQYLVEKKDGSGVLLLVTSSRPGEGKTSTVANLGVSLAQGRKRVLLVDADIRRPSLHTHFGQKNRQGLTYALLHRDKDPASLVQDTSIAGVRLLPAGRALMNPVGLFSAPETPEFLAQLTALADYVILDVPPALGVADATILAQHVDGVLLVTEAGKTRRDMLRRAVTVLESVKAPLIGAVLNKMTALRHSYYGDPYYGRAKGHSGRRGRRQRTAPGPEHANEYLTWLRRAVAMVPWPQRSRSEQASRRAPGKSAGRN